MNTVTELQLCTRRDVAECQADVRRLSGDLPDFDSVWIDTLVQKRILTPWQANLLESASPEQLRVGEYLKCDALGAKTFLAKADDDHQLVVVYVLPDADRSQRSESSTIVSRCHQLLQQLDDLRHTVPEGLSLPTDVAGDSGSAMALIGPFVPGWTGDELLIRGGRMPWRTVAEIGRELLKGLSWLEHYGFLHGDICLRNIRVRPDGIAVLVSPFFGDLHPPQRSFTTDLRLRDVETAAPELFGFGHQPDIRSDMYSIGCVLWQLLTARPPFLSADPVNKIVKSQENDLPDVREIVPDCPDWMARIIHSLARRSPDLRPLSGHDVALQWDAECPNGVRATRRLLQRLPDRAKRTATVRQRHPTVRQRAAPIVATCLLIGFFITYGLSRGLLPQTLRLNRESEVAESISAGHTNTPVSAALTLDIDAINQPEDIDAQGFHRMPQPDAAGVVVLNSGRQYSAADLRFAGVLHVETTDIQLAEVVVPTGQSWHIKASQVAMNNVQVTAMPTDLPDSGQPLVDCSCEVLSLTRCLLQTNNQAESETCLKWNASTAVAAVISLTDCVMSGRGYGLWMNQPPNRLTLDNVLSTTAAAAVRCDVGPAAAAFINMKLNRVSHVGGRGFLDVVAKSPGPERLRVEIMSGESVLAPRNGLVRIAGPNGWSRSRCYVGFLLPERGNPTVVPPGIRPAVFLDRSLNSLIEIDDQQLVTDALLIASPIFADTSMSDSDGGGRFAAFDLIDYEGPKLSANLPGVTVGRLP